MKSLMLLISIVVYCALFLVGCGNLDVREPKDTAVEPMETGLLTSFFGEIGIPVATLELEESPLKIILAFQSHLEDWIEGQTADFDYMKGNFRPILYCVNDHSYIIRYEWARRNYTHEYGTAWTHCMTGYFDFVEDKAYACFLSDTGDMNINDRFIGLEIIEQEGSEYAQYIFFLQDHLMGEPYKIEIELLNAGGTPTGESIIVVEPGETFVAELPIETELGEITYVNRYYEEDAPMKANRYRGTISTLIGYSRISKSPQVTFVPLNKDIVQSAS